MIRVSVLLKSLSTCGVPVSVVFEPGMLAAVFGSMMSIVPRWRWVAGRRNGDERSA